MKAELAARGHAAGGRRFRQSSATRMVRSVVFRGNFTELTCGSGRTATAGAGRQRAVACRKASACRFGRRARTASRIVDMNACSPAGLPCCCSSFRAPGSSSASCAAAIAMTFLQSIGLYSLIGASPGSPANTGGRYSTGRSSTPFLFSLKVGLGSAFGTLIFAYPLALFLRRRGFGTRAHRLDRQDPAVRAGAGGRLPDPQRAGLSTASSTAC